MEEATDGNGEAGRGGGEFREVLEGQQKELMWQWTWSKVIRTEADWKRQQMEMGKLEEAVENSERCWRDGSSGGSSRRDIGCVSCCGGGGGSETETVKCVGRSRG